MTTFRRLLWVVWVGLGTACGGGGNPCADVDCGEHGLCAVRGDSAFCVCEQGYHFNGVSCVGEMDPCQDATCLDEHRGCSVVDGQAVCGDCLTGYHEEGDECVGDTTCDGNATCNDHGTCDDRSGTVVCTCDEGYAGERCETCATGYQDYGDGACRPSDPCATDTLCSALHRTCQNDQGVAECGDCLNGYHEEQGECLPDETCSGNATCNDHGTCDDTSGTVVCTCDEGYAGPRCEYCAPGYADLGNGRCEPVTDPCASDTACAAQKRRCVNRAGVAVCGDCLAGYHFESGQCVPDCTDPVLVPISPLPEPRNRIGVTAVRDGKIYILGGTWEMGQYARFSRKVWAYDTLTDSYEEVGRDLLPYAMSLGGHELEWEAGKLYAPPEIGPGWNNGWGQHTNMVEIDLLADLPSARETNAAFPSRRWGTAMARGGNGFLYLFGSYDGNRVYDIHRYDPGQDSLTRLSADLHLNQAGFVAETAELASDGLVYLVGVWNGETGHLAVFDPGSETLALLPDRLPCRTWYHFWEEPPGTLWGICVGGSPRKMMFFVYDTATGSVHSQDLFDLPIVTLTGTVDPAGVAEDLDTGAVYFFGGTNETGAPVADAFRLSCVGPTPW